MLVGMRKPFLVATSLVLGYAVSQSGCGGKVLQLGTDGGVDGGGCPPCGHLGPDVAQPDVRETDVSIGDVVVVEDSQPFESGLEDGDSEPPIDAGGLLPHACEECLSKECPTPYDKCLDDPSCVTDIRCLDNCVAHGGSPDSCAIHCIDMGDVDAGDIATQLLECAEDDCAAACGATATDAGGAGDEGVD
jgi:hypothetical protein